MFRGYDFVALTVIASLLAVTLLPVLRGSVRTELADAIAAPTPGNRLRSRQEPRMRPLPAGGGSSSASSTSAGRSGSNASETKASVE